MSINTSLPINFIADEVRKPQTEKPWSLEVSQKLARDIAEKVDAHRINIRVVQEKDNLGRIAEGLSHGEIKSKNEGGFGWEVVEVEYIGDSAEIAHQKKANPSKKLSTASLIFPNQYVFLKDNTHVVVTANLEKIKQLFKVNHA